PRATDSHTLSLHDALPLSLKRDARRIRGEDRLRLHARADILEYLALYVFALRHRLDDQVRVDNPGPFKVRHQPVQRIAPLDTRIDRKSTRLNSSHEKISYA